MCLIWRSHKSRVIKPPLITCDFSVPQNWGKNSTLKKFPGFSWLGMQQNLGFFLDWSLCSHAGNSDLFQVLEDLRCSHFFIFFFPFFSQIPRNSSSFFFSSSGSSASNVQVINLQPWVPNSPKILLPGLFSSGAFVFRQLFAAITSLLEALPLQLPNKKYCWWFFHGFLLWIKLLALNEELKQKKKGKM